MSDYAFAGYKPVCQRKLMHAMARSELGAAAARTFPPSLLEWTANRRQASMALDLHCFNGEGSVVLGHCAGQGGPSVPTPRGRGDWWHPLTACPSPGDQFSCPIHSWSTGEDLAGDVLKLRYVVGTQWVMVSPGAVFGVPRIWEPERPAHSGVSLWSLCPCPVSGCWQRAGRGLAWLDRGYEGRCTVG